MLSDSLHLLVGRLVPASTPDARIIRFTPVAIADAQEACWRGGHLIADKDVERALESAGVSLEPRESAGQVSLVWARLDEPPETESEADISPVSGSRPASGLSLYRIEAADRRPATGSSQWLVEAHCWRRGPDGSIAIYEIDTRRPVQRVFEAEIETIDDATAGQVSGSIFRQIAIELVPLVVHAVMSTQGNDPDWKPDRDWLS
jgi:hypothetical protein